MTHPYTLLCIGTWYRIAKNNLNEDFVKIKMIKWQALMNYIFSKSLTDLIRKSKNCIEIQNFTKIQNLIQKSKFWSKDAKLDSKIQNLVQRSKIWSRDPKIGPKIQNLIQRSKTWSKDPELDPKILNLIQNPKFEPNIQLYLLIGKFKICIINTKFVLKI